MLTAFDYAVLLIILASAVRGAWRGLVAELMSLVGWIAALIIAARFASQVARYLPADWPGGALTQWLIGFGVVALGVMLVSSIMSAVLARLTEASGLRSADRSMGMLFGIARGALIVMAVFLAAQFTELPQMSFWRTSLLRPWVEQGVHAVKPFLPAVLAAYVRD